MFSTEKNGFDKDEVIENITKVYSEYEKLFAANLRLREQNKKLKEQFKVTKN